MTDTFVWKAHADSNGGGDFTLSKVQFGDGYQQTAPLGINAEVQKWSVRVGAYYQEMQTIIDFLRTHKGQSFFWTPPFTAQGYYQCDAFKPVHQGGGFWTLNVEFYQVFVP
jgi:phage-related protein